jgi:NTF2-related export protein 1/2
MIKWLPSIEIAVQAGTSFVQLYYAAYDADGRAEDVPKFYRTHSAISWNGNPIQGPDGLADLLKKMPATSHNVQSFDCHPVPSQPFSFSPLNTTETDAH